MTVKAKKNRWTRRWRKKRIVNGCCANCNRPRSKKSSRFCDECLSKIEGSMDNLREKRLADGCCERCGGSKEGGTKRHCRACANTQNAYARKYMRKNRAHYNDMLNERRKERQKKGLCIRCGKPRSDKSKQLCDDHLEAQRKRAT